MASRSSAPMPPGCGRAARRFAEVVCPPEIRAGDRAGRLLKELGLMLGSLPPAARRVLAGTLLTVDQGARLYPAARGRRLARLDDRVAQACLGSLLARRDPAAGLAKRLKSVVVMCYYELPEVQREIGYHPDPFIAAVSRRRLERHGAEIRAAEAGRAGPGAPGPRRP